MELPDGSQLILEEEVDENYEPSHDEIIEYAQWLGMDLQAEQELIWIAKDGLKAPLPSDWKPCKTPGEGDREGDIYYFNFSTGESIWDHPCDEFYRKLYADEKAKLEQRRQQERKQTTRSSTPSSLPPAVTVSNPSSLAPLKKIEPLGVSRVAVKDSLSGSSSLHNSFESGPITGGSGGTPGLGPLKEGPKPLGSLNPLKPLSMSGDLPGASSSKQLNPLSQSTGQALNPLGPIPSGVRTSSDLMSNSRDILLPPNPNPAVNHALLQSQQEALASIKAKHEEEKAALEQKLTLDLENVKASIKLAHSSQLSKMRDTLASEERDEERSLRSDKEKRVLAIQRKLEEEERLEVEEIEMSLEQHKSAALDRVEREAKEWAEKQSPALRQQALQLNGGGPAVEGAGAAAAAAAARRQKEEEEAKVAEAKKQLQSLQFQISDKTALSSALQVEIGSKTSQISELDDQIVTMKAEITAMNKTISNKQQELVEAEEGLSSSLEESSRVKDQVASLTSQLEELEKQIDEKLQQSQSQLAAGTLSIEMRERAEDEYSQIQEELKNARREIEAAYTEVQQRSSELDALEEKLDSVSRDLSTKQNLHVKISQSIADAANELQGLDLTLEAKRAELNRCIESLTSAQQKSEYQMLKAKLSDEERTLLELRRSQMERSVAEQVEAERKLLTSQAMREITAKELSQPLGPFFDPPAPLPSVHPPPPALSPPPSSKDSVTISQQDLASLISQAATAAASAAMSQVQSSSIPPNVVNPPSRAAWPAVPTSQYPLFPSAAEPGPNANGGGAGVGPDMSMGAKHVLETLSRMINMHESGPYTSSSSPPHHPFTSLPRQHYYASSRAERLGDSSGEHVSILLSQARSLLKEKKGEIRERQSVVQAAKDEWKAKMLLVGQNSGEERVQQSRALNQLKQALEREIKHINKEAASLNVLRDQVKNLEGSRGDQQGVHRVTSVDDTLEAVTSTLRDAGDFSLPAFRALLGDK